MLNLTRRPKKGQDRIIFNPGTPDEIVIEVRSIDFERRQVTLGVDAPKSINVVREEVLQREA